MNPPNNNRSNTDMVANAQARLEEFFDLFGESRDEAVRLLDEYTRTDPMTMPEVRSELHQQLSALYNEHVGDSRWNQFTDAVVYAYQLYQLGVLLPGTEVHGENQATHADSPLTDSANSNQQHSHSNTGMHAEQGGVESSTGTSMSFIESRALFQNNDGLSNSGSMSIDTNTKT